MRESRGKLCWHIWHATLKLLAAIGFPSHPTSLYAARLHQIHYNLDTSSSIQFKYSSVLISWRRVGLSCIIILNTDLSIFAANYTRIYKFVCTALWILSPLINPRPKDEALVAILTYLITRRLWCLFRWTDWGRADWVCPKHWCKIGREPSCCTPPFVVAIHSSISTSKRWASLWQQWQRQSTEIQKFEKFIPIFKSKIILDKLDKRISSKS